jgi:arsenate reductase
MFSGDEEIRILFMCLHNDNRSPMAAAWVNHLFGEGFKAESAGLEPWPIHPLTLQVMEEVGIKISGHKPRRVFDLFLRDVRFHFAITLWDRKRFERRAHYPMYVHCLTWEIPDPFAEDGLKRPMVDRFREVRDLLKENIQHWISAAESENRFPYRDQTLCVKSPT